MTTVVIHAYPGNVNSFKAQIAGQYGGVTVTMSPNFKMGVENKSPEFLKKNPFGEVPTADTPDGPLFESNAIARYVARKGSDAGLLGSNPYEASQIDQWMEAVRSNESRIFPYLGNMMGFFPYNETQWNNGKAAVARVLGIVNAHLENREFIVGKRVTLADIVLWVSLGRAFQMADPEVRAPLTNFHRWYEKLHTEAAFKAVVPEIKYSTEVAKPKLDLAHH